jgi:hypothetical protein
MISQSFCAKEDKNNAGHSTISKWRGAEGGVPVERKDVQYGRMQLDESMNQACGTSRKGAG